MGFNSFYYKNIHLQIMLFTIIACFFLLFLFVFVWLLRFGSCAKGSQIMLLRTFSHKLLVFLLINCNWLYNVYNSNMKGFSASNGQFSGEFTIKSQVFNGNYWLQQCSFFISQWFKNVVEVSLQRLQCSQYLHLVGFSKFEIITQLW